MDTSNSRNGPIVWFDDACLVCNRSVQFILENEKDSRLSFGALQSTEGQRLQKSVFGDSGKESIFYQDSDGNLHHSSDATIAIAQHLKAPWSLIKFSKWIPRSIRNGIYHWISRNRYRLYKKAGQCIVPSHTIQARMIPYSEPE
ncbi:MAG: thiol-disulfide oxidoreductase DCC family protein [Opitutales bacterium]